MCILSVLPPVDMEGRGLWFWLHFWKLSRHPFLFSGLNKSGLYPLVVNNTSIVTGHLTLWFVWSCDSFKIRSFCKRWCSLKSVAWPFFLLKISGTFRTQTLTFAWKCDCQSSPLTVIRLPLGCVQKQRVSPTLESTETILDVVIHHKLSVLGTTVASEFNSIELLPFLKLRRR